MSRSSEFRPKIKRFKTVVHALGYYAECQPDKEAYSFIRYKRNNETIECRLTFGEIAGRSAMLASWLKRNFASGEKAILMYPPSMDFIVSFYGCLLAGVIAVPIYLPDTGPEINRLKSIIETSGSSYILMDSKTFKRFYHLRDDYQQIGATEWIDTDILLQSEITGDVPIVASANDTALIQYTSGSTSAPKGVEVQHSNLVHNLISLGEYFQVSQNDKMAIWIPHYHDMGLISGIIFTLYHGITNTLFSPFDFIRNPIRWLEIISQTGSTISLAPNFAFDLCARKVSDEQLQSLDLSTWELAFNASEPVYYETMACFSEKFKECGFRKETFYPAYGLAESTLLVSGGERDALPVVKKVNKSKIRENLVFSPEPDDFTFVVGCGKSIRGNTIRIVDPASQKTLKDNEIGEVWFQSPSVAKGYYGISASRNDTFNGYTSDTGEGPFLKTGDLGFLCDDELFITGRLKDVIILRGKNYYPNDIEHSITGSHPGCREGCCAVFSIENENAQYVIAIVEIRKEFYDADKEQIRRNIRSAVSRDYGISLYDLVLLKQKTIAKTSSGKIQRNQNRINYSAGALNIV